MTKICTTCLLEKDISNFHREKRERDGYRSRCKDCRKEYYNNNKEREKKRANRWYYNNKERHLKNCTSYYQNNINEIKEYKREHQKRNRHIYYANGAKRRAQKLNATPAWADLDKIRQIYKTCPKGYHVDHIIPLQGKKVCGLHVHYNLQHLPASENLSKSNKL